MPCECFQIGGRFIGEDPDCPTHGTEATGRRSVEELVREAELQHIATLEQNLDAALEEIAAWRARFSRYEYRRQDEIVTLKLETKA